MTVDEAKAVAERAHLGSTMVTDLVEAVQCLAAAVRDDDMVVAPQGVSVNDNPRYRINHGCVYCLRKDLPKPTRKVVLREWYFEGNNGIRVCVQENPPDGLWRPTGNTREIEVPNE